jgi:signal transduction histidine kinase
MAARLSMTARRAMTFESGMVKTMKTMTARECRAEERREILSRLLIHATTPPRYAAS